MKKVSLISLTVLCCFVACFAVERKAKVAATSGDAKSQSAKQAKLPSWAKVSKAQLAEAKKLGVPVAFANSAGVKFVLIPAGEFMMGSADDEPGRYKVEGPQHKVKIGTPYYMAIHQLTQGQWKAVMGATPWKGKGGAKDNPDHAVNHVNWNQVMEFCAKMGGKDKKTYRPPTEAEWEYACRAGSTTRFCYGDDLEAKKLGEYAWFMGNWVTDKPEDRYVRKVGMKKPNAWGIYDMHGNVWELCMDSKYPTYDGAPTDGSAHTGDDSRVLRGGGLRSTDRRCRTASRHAYHRTHSSYYVGSRITCAIAKKTK